MIDVTFYYLFIVEKENKNIDWKNVTPNGFHKTHTHLKYFGTTIRLKLSNYNAKIVRREAIQVPTPATNFQKKKKKN